MVRAVLEKSLAKGSVRLVLFVLAEHANDRGVCWPSVALIAAEAAVSERTAQSALNALAGVGKGALDPPEIERVLYGAPLNGRRQHRPSLYRLLLPSGDERCTTRSEVVVQAGAASGAKPRAPVVQTVAPKSSGGTTREPTSSHGPVATNSADDDGRFEQVLNLETAQRVARRRASTNGEAIRAPTAYWLKIRTTLLKEEGASILAALVSHPALTAAEIVREQIWRSPAEPLRKPWCGRCDGTGQDPEDFDDSENRVLPCRACGGSRFIDDARPHSELVDATEIV
jgi:hypothetical protein